MEANPGIDPVSGVRYHVLAIAVRYFFPDKAHSEQDKNIFDHKDIPHNVFLTGSKIENLDMPDLRGPASLNDFMVADYDCMICTRLQEYFPFTVENCKLYPTLTPGYCYLNVPSLAALHYPRLVTRLNEKYFLNNYLLKNSMFSPFENYTRQVYASQNVNSPVLDERVGDDATPNFVLTHRTNQFDFVPCFANPWPDDALAWRNRKRTQGWPKPDMIDSVVAAGCHLVSKSHQLSKHPGIEWRYSFSKAEISLCATLNSMQRLAYRVFKALIKNHKETRELGIPSYFLKTTLFWVCETSNASSWILNNLGKSLLCLIDTFLGYLRSHNLPMYFIPENNLIIHLSEEEINKWISCVEYIRRHPLQCMEDFHSEHKIRQISNVFRDHIRNGYRLLREYNSFGDPSSLVFLTGFELDWFGLYYGTECYHGMVLSIAKINIEIHGSEGENHAVLKEKEYAEFKDEVQLLKEFYITLINMIKPVGSVGILLSKMVKNFIEYTNYLSSFLKAELACVYYQLYEISDDDTSSKRDTLVETADTFFLEAVDCKTRRPNVLVKCAQYLVVRKKYAEAFALLKEIVGDKSQVGFNSLVIYSRYTCYSAEETMRLICKANDTETSFVVGALAYYLALICCREMRREPEESGVPKIDEIDQRGELTLFEGCILLRYGDVHRALKVFIQSQNRHATFYVKYCVALLMCQYREQLMMKMVIFLRGSWTNFQSSILHSS